MTAGSAMKGKVFRKVSIDRLSSPEQLDQIMQVTTPRGWIALATICALLSGTVVWGFYGSVPTNVRAMGVLIKSGGVYDIVPRAGGLIADVAVRPGDVVNAGQVLARVDQPLLIDQIKKARLNLAELRSRHRQLQAYGSMDTALQTDLAVQQRRDLEQSIRGTTEQIAWLDEKIANQSRLLNEGLITKQVLLSSRQQLQTAEEHVEQLRHELKQIDIRTLARENQRRQEMLAGELQIAAATHEIERLEDQLRLISEVTSPYTGRILEVMAEAGSIVGEGRAIMRLDLVGDHIQELEAVLYISATDGKKVRDGMDVQISPATVPREEHGYMEAVVSRVSDFPATPEAMVRVLKNQQLVGVLSGGGAPYETYASLKLDSRTVSGFKWSSSSGPPTRIQSGTICSATITVASHRPAEMVLPILKRFLGV